MWWAGKSLLMCGQKRVVGTEQCCLNGNNGIPWVLSVSLSPQGIPQWLKLELVKALEPMHWKRRSLLPILLSCPSLTRSSLWQLSQGVDMPTILCVTSANCQYISSLPYISVQQKHQYLEHFWNMDCFAHNAWFVIQWFIKFIFIWTRTWLRHIAHSDNDIHKSHKMYADLFLEVLRFLFYAWKAGSRLWGLTWISADYSWNYSHCLSLSVRITTCVAAWGLLLCCVVNIIFDMCYVVSVIISMCYVVSIIISMCYVVSIIIKMCYVVNIIIIMCYMLMWSVSTIKYHHQYVLRGQYHYWCVPVWITWTLHCHFAITCCALTIFQWGGKSETRTSARSSNDA